MTFAVPLPPEALALLPVPLAAPVLEELDGLLLHAAVAAASASNVAPTAYWLHGQLGYEVNSWLMLLGEAELAYTDTSESVDESHVTLPQVHGAARRCQRQRQRRGADRVSGAFHCASHSLAPLPGPVTVDRVTPLSTRVPGSGMADVIKDPYALN